MEENPYLESAILEVVENQLQTNDPPETRQTFDRLISEGYSEEEAKKLIGCIVSSEIFDILKKQEPFNPERYIKALEYFNKNLEINTSKPEYFIARANTYLRTSTYKYAANDYSMALDLDPTNEQVYFNRGIARLKMGKIKDACYDWKQALKYGHPEAQEYLSKYCQ